eukprot:6203841-Pleurochrysis_carterae.AAC.3
MRSTSVADSRLCTARAFCEVGTAEPMPILAPSRAAAPALARARAFAAAPVIALAPALALELVLEPAAVPDVAVLNGAVGATGVQSLGDDDPLRPCDVEEESGRGPKGRLERKPNES